MVHQFTGFFKRQNIPLSGQRFLLAVSGGLDSAVLCRLCKDAGISFAIVHCNFGLRGEESDRDEAFVRALAEQYNVAVYVAKFDTTGFAAENKLSIQEAARKLRYDWFEEVRKEHGFAYTFLAHHANDTIETVLMNFFRGTGLEGLTGMPEQKVESRCLRPMLHMKRSEIEAYASEHHLPWVEDSSNASDKYTRNFFRNTLLPQVQTVFPQAEENLLKNIQRLQQTNALYKELVAGLKKKICERKGEELHIPVLKLMQYRDTSLIYEIIHDFGFGENYVEEVIRLAAAPSGRYITNGQYRIIRHRAWLIIAPVAATAQTIVIEREHSAVLFDNQQLLLTLFPLAKFALDKSPLLAQLDAKDIRFPLILRKWKRGDYFYPLGMRKKKKVARFFIDQKLSQTQKEKVWVLESHQRVVWIVGHRIDDRFKITESTKEILQLSLSSL